MKNEVESADDSRNNVVPQDERCPETERSQVRWQSGNAAEVRSEETLVRGEFVQTKNMKLLRTRDQSGHCNM